MRVILFSLLALTLLLGSALTSSASQTCLGCHDFGPDSPVHPMLDSAHGDADQGCEACHGPSTVHTQRPTMVSPSVSFGPRWTAQVAEQDSQCLACHADNVGEHWQDALHMANNMTCVACHDMHTVEDAALNPHRQAEVCTVCHKVQKDGIHALSEKKADNPVCTTCHNPHADQSPVGMMLTNRSEGCRNCHDLVTMASSRQVSEKATSYHKVMVQTDRTCLDCHQGVAHGPPGAVEPFVPLPVAGRAITLFYPAQSDIDWVLSEHPGAQPFRQGSNCQQCHRGDEASMGASLGERQPTSRQVNLRFRTEEDKLLVELTWNGDAEDVGIALMWGDEGNGAFRRGGCWAACHSDMPGMSRDRGRELGKYLAVSRQQQQRIGQPPLDKGAADLNKLLAAGNFVDMWRVSLANAEVETATLLAAPDWGTAGTVTGKARFADGRWTVNLQRPLAGGSQQKDFVAGKRYTFGIALHSKDRPGAQHWVSLPMTLSLDGDDTDFIAN